MTYVEQNLQPGESLIYRAHLHPVRFVGPALIALIGVLMFIGGLSQPHPSGGAMLLAMLLCVPLLLAYLGYSSSEFAVTSERVIIKVGVLRRRSLETLLGKVEGVAVDQGIVGRMFDYGTIYVTGTGGTKEPFRMISAPLEFRRYVQAQIRVSASSTPPVAPTSAVAAREERECPHCAERILAKAKTCKHCGRDV